MFDQQDETIFADTFEYIDEKPSAIIKINGKRVRLSSGKSVWSSVRAAKGAMTHHLYSYRYKLYAKYNKSDVYREERNDFYHHFIEEMEKRGILEFVSLNA